MLVWSVAGGYFWFTNWYGDYVECFIIFSICKKPASLVLWIERCMGLIWDKPVQIKTVFI
jgi:hypothetical protein